VFDSGGWAELRVLARAGDQIHPFAGAHIWVLADLIICSRALLSVSGGPLDWLGGWIE